MQTKVQKWGNSLAVRLPKPFTDEVGLEENGAVEIKLVEEGILIKPRKRLKYTLEELLEGMTEEHLHGEIDYGPPVGKEILEG